MATYHPRPTKNIAEMDWFNDGIGTKEKGFIR